MSNLKDFKNIADELMKDIKVSNELKQNTLNKLNSKKNSMFRNTLVPVMTVMILAILIVLGDGNFKTQSHNNADNKNETVNILKEPLNSKDNSKTTVSVSLNSLEEAKIFLGYNEIEISYIPKEYKLINIQGVNFKVENRKGVWFQYEKEKSSFVISIEENSHWKSFEGYKDVDINGLAGHLKAFEDNSYKSAELRWFKRKTFLTIEGQLSEEEALKIAKAIRVD